MKNQTRNSVSSSITPLFAAFVLSACGQGGSPSASQPVRLAQVEPENSWYSLQVTNHDHTDDEVITPDDSGNESNQAKLDTLGLGAKACPSGGGSIAKGCTEKDWGNLTFNHDGHKLPLYCPAGTHRTGQRYTGTSDPCEWKNEKSDRIELFCKKPGRTGTHDADHVYITCCADAKETPKPTTTPKPTSTPTITPTVTSTPTVTPTVTPNPTPSYTQVPDGACFIQKQNQQLGADVKTLDLLFVMDTSGSMSSERTKIANSIESFINELPAHVDYRVSVMLGHSSKSKYTGLLYSKPGNPFILDSRTMSRATIKTKLVENLTNLPSDHYADGGEELLYSLSRALSSTLNNAGSANSFFRNDAALAVVFVTDENDICHPGVAYDSEGLEKPAYDRDCKGKVNATSVYEQIKLLQANRPVVLGGIVYTHDQPVDPKRMNENEKGLGIIDIVQANKGILVDLALANYADGLRQIGQSCAKKIDLKTEFIIHYQDFDPSSVQVWVDSKGTAFQLDGGTVKIDVADAGQAGSEVAIHYCLKPVTPPSPSPTVSPTVNPSPVVSPVVEPSPTVSPAVSPTVDPSPVVSPVVEPSPTVSPAVSPTVDPSPTPSQCVTIGCDGGWVGI